MGVVIRQTLKTTVVLYMAALLGVLNRIILMPRILKADEIGLLDTVTYLAMILASLGSLGMISSLNKFHQKYRNRGNYGNLLGFAFRVSILGIASIILLSLIFKGNIVAIYSNDVVLLQEYFYLVPILAALILFRNYFTTFSALELRITVPGIVNNFLLKFLIAMGLTSMYLQVLGFHGFMLLYVLIYIVMVALLTFYSVRILKFNFSDLLKSINVSKDRTTIYKYSIFIIASGLSIQITSFADTLMLGGMKGLEFAGIYGVAMFIGASIEIPKKALTNISSTVIASKFEEEKLTEIDKLYHQTSINQGLIAFLLFLLILFNLDFIFAIVNNPIYEVGKSVTLIIAASKVIDMFSGINAQILVLSKHFNYDLYLLTAFIAVTIALNYFLIPIYGINGAAIATLISVILYNVSRFLILYWFYRFNPFSKESLLLLLIFAAFVLVYFVVPNPGVQSIFMASINTAIKSVVLITVFMITVYKFKISSEVNMILDKYLVKR